MTPQYQQALKDFIATPTDINKIVADFDLSYRDIIKDQLINDYHYYLSNNVKENKIDYSVLKDYLFVNFYCDQANKIKKGDLLDEYAAFKNIYKKIVNKDNIDEMSALFYKKENFNIHFLLAIHVHLQLLKEFNQFSIAEKDKNRVNFNETTKRLYQKWFFALNKNFGDDKIKSSYDVSRVKNLSLTPEGVFFWGELNRDLNEADLETFLKKSIFFIYNLNDPKEIKKYDIIKYLLTVIDHHAIDTSLSKKHGKTKTAYSKI